MAEIVGLLSSHVWEPIAEPLERLADRAGDAGVGVQDKRFARAQALMKLARDRNGNPLPVAILAHEKLASDFGRALGLSINEVLLSKLGPAWGDAEGSWASLHVLVPEPFERLEERPGGGQDILSGADTATLANDDEIRQMRLFDAVIMNGDRHPGNILVSGGRESGRLWAYLIDHAYAFGGAVDPAQLAAETAGKRCKTYIQDRSSLQEWWDAQDDAARAKIMPLARKIADFRDEDVKSLVRSLPEGLADGPTKRFLTRVLLHHISIVRDEID
jgi:hypothetical protein